MSDKPQSDKPESEKNSASDQPDSSQSPVESSAPQGNGFDLGTVIDDAKKIITNPGEFFRSMPTEGGYANPVIFVVVMALATALIGFIFGAIGIAKFNAMIGGAVTIGMIILLPIFAVIGSFIGAAILFVIWKLMGSEKNYETAYRCFAYSMAIAPIVAVLSLIPYIAGVIKSLWSGFLFYTASTEVHKIKAETAKIVFGILTAIFVLMSINGERTARKWQGKLAGFEEQAARFEKEMKQGTLGYSVKNMKDVEDMTPEEAGKQVGEFLKGLEKFSEGLEESVKESEEE
jgi:hypothetical protein